jgi:hypothetical protein
MNPLNLHIDNIMLDMDTAMLGIFLPISCQDGMDELDGMITIENHQNS